MRGDGGEAAILPARPRARSRTGSQRAPARGGLTAAARGRGRPRDVTGKMLRAGAAEAGSEREEPGPALNPSAARRCDSWGSRLPASPVPGAAARPPACPRALLRAAAPAAACAEEEEPGPAAGAARGGREPRGAGWVLQERGAGRASSAAPERSARCSPARTAPALRRCGKQGEAATKHHLPLLPARTGLSSQHCRTPPGTSDLADCGQVSHIAFLLGKPARAAVKVMSDPGVGPGHNRSGVRGTDGSSAVHGRRTDQS